MARYCFFFSIMIFAMFVERFTQARGELMTYKYCVPVNKIDLNPFREIVDGKDLAYLQLLRSYISTDSKTEGLLEKFEFSPDGLSFTGKINSNIKWNDGSVLNSREAAYSIVKGLQFRPLGERVKIKGVNRNINSGDWYSKSYEGVLLIDDLTFKLTFESKIDNLNGVFREALSSNSRHNRFWPVKLSRANTTESPEVLGKNPIIWILGTPHVRVGNENIAIVNGEACTNAEYGLYSESLNANMDLYTYERTTNSQAITVQTNTTKLSIEERRALIAWIRLAFSQSDKAEIVAVDSFFLKGEAGFESKFGWPKAPMPLSLRKKKFVLAYEIPIFRQVLSNFAKKSQLSVNFVQLPAEQSKFDAQVLSSGIHNGRHVILQDLLKWAHVTSLISGAPRTQSILRKISNNSASTIPPDDSILHSFETTALSEFALAPVARRQICAFSKKSLKVKLTWDATGEVNFSQRSTVSK